MTADPQAIKPISYLSPEGVLAPDCPVDISKDILIKGYKTMVLTRHVEERMITLQRQSVITFAMCSLGEEACAVASAAALDPADWMYPQYREAGVIFWRGFTIQEFVHQMFCNAEDLIKGRQMPNHFGSRTLNIVQVSSPIGTKIPHAAGSAYAMKLLKEKTIAICYFGEGASSEGDFHVGLNFAAVRKAPAVFFCRNNGYAISTPAYRQFASDGVTPKGIGYGMPAYRVDGNDFFAVYAVTAEARRHALEGNGPTLIEAMTYRLGPHSTADDPSVYRKESEVECQAGGCPILRLRRYLEAKGWWGQQQEDEWNAAVAKETTEAIEKAKQTPKPPMQSLFEHVYFELTPVLNEQLDELQRNTR
jgi:2-oxoisovalerate dehydrogenase E1 component alpha subunit